MEYLFSGNNIFLRTKRGSTLISDITRKPHGAALYTYNLSVEKLIWVDNINIVYSDVDGSNETTISGVLTANLQMYFQMYGQQTNAALYGVNGTDSMIKISGSTPTLSTITSPVMDYITYSTLLGILVGVKGHNVYVSDQQVGTGTAQLETWPLTSNPTAIVSPDDGQGFKAVIDLGTEGIYFFKDTGIWVLPNGNESLRVDWRFPKVEADIGTISPKTVRKVNYGNTGGIIYLATDKTLKFIRPKLSTYGSGDLPSVTNSDAKTISKNFQKTLNNIPRALLSQCTATYWERYYILNIPGTASSTKIDRTIIIDTEKLFKQKGDEIAQPFFLDSENMDYTEFVIRPTNSNLIGFSVNGYISRLFIQDKYVEEMPSRLTVDQESTVSGSTRTVAIEYEAYLSWFNYSRDARGSQLELNRLYLNYETFGDWGIMLSINAFNRGQAIPLFDEGLTTDLPAPDISGGKWDVGLWDQMLWAGDGGSASQNSTLRNKGHYFAFGFKKTAINEATSIFGVEPIFKRYTNDSIGRR